MSIKNKKGNSINRKAAKNKPVDWEKGLKKGRVRKYIMRKDGSSGFNKNGTLKVSAIKNAMKNTKDKNMKKALGAALALKRIPSWRKK